MRRCLAVLLLMGLLHAVDAYACTTVAVRDADGSVALIGKSYDWGTQAAMVIANMTGITKKALVFPSSDPTVPQKAVSWASKYNSITINQYGLEFPAAGMNEYGLVVETMEMDPGSKHAGETIYKPDGATEVINANQWVQYILDSFTSVDDFLRTPPDFAIMPDTVPVHFMVCDRSECAVVEIIKNALVITRGEAMGVNLQSGDFIPVYALTNDFYDCSVHGTNGDRTLALEDYIGFGGSRFIPSGTDTYADDPKSTGYCLSLPPGIGCDYACRRDKNGAWYNANSVERFVRAAAGSSALSGSSATVDDMFKLLNEVVSQDSTTGGTKWQIVYDLGNMEIHWRTNADGIDDQFHPGADGRLVKSNRFTGQIRSLKFNDVTFGDCTHRSAMIVNIDEAPACSSTNAGPSCNPNPGLPSCLGSGCQMLNYNEDFNRKLVEFAAEHSEVDLIGFVSKIRGFLKDIDDDTAETIMFNIWGGYPRGFTACNGAVQSEDVVNLYLSSLLDPYINPRIRPAMNNVNLTYDKKGTALFSFEVKGKITGHENTTLDDMHVTKDSPSDKLTITGHIPKLQTTGDLTVHIPVVDAKGTITVSFPVDPFSIVTHGAHTSDDSNKPLCFDKVTKVDSVNPTVGKITCTITVAVGTLNYSLPEEVTDALCNNVVTEAMKEAVKGALQVLGIDVVIGSLPQCEAATVSEPLEASNLTAGWGDLSGKYVTAREGHTYILEAEVNADRDSYSREFATFGEALPSDDNLMRIDTVRMRSHEGSERVTALWKPGSAGDKDLFFDVFRWNEETDEVTPAVLRVRVFPAEGPSSWKDMTIEAMSPKLKEVK